MIGPRLETFSVMLEDVEEGHPARQGRLAEAIDRLPPSLTAFDLDCTFPRDPCTELDQAISSMILRCGSTLNNLAIDLELSELAVNRVLQLPHLERLRISQDVPRSVAAHSESLQSSEVFPSLRELTLFAQPDNWLSFLTSQEGIRKNLRVLVCAWEPRDGRRALVMQALALKNLVDLRVGRRCPTLWHQCNFDLTDDDISLIATTLPHLTRLRLGITCEANTCPNTFKSLLDLSTGCTGLTELQIHFNTTNLEEDIKSTMASESAKKPRCRLAVFSANEAALSGSEDSELIAQGFLGVFPMLESFYPATVGEGWGGVAEVVERTRQNRLVQSLS